MDYTIHYSTITDTTFVEGNELGKVPASITPGGSERITVKTITIYNSDSSSKTVFIQLNSITLAEVELSAYDTLIYDDNITLNSTTESLILMTDLLAGYIAGNLAVNVDKLVYSTDTTAAQSSANISQARIYLAGSSNLAIAGYFAGGNSGAVVVTADKLVYSTDTTAAQSSANLSVARYILAGVSNANKAGYFAGGDTTLAGNYVATADKLVYSTDTTTAQSSANLSQATAQHGGTSNHGIAGYFAGGITTVEVATAHKLVYSTDTTAVQSSANLSGARYSLAGVSNLAIAGYFAGGNTGAGVKVATADKLVYSTDTTAAQSSANLSLARAFSAGVSNLYTSGYFAGGITGGATGEVTTDKLVYSTDTTAAQSSANLSGARYGLAGVDG